MNKIEYVIFGIAAVALAAGFIWAVSRPAGATAPVPYKVICHHNPAQDVTLEFQNEQSYQGHLGQPHSATVFDTDGPCVTVTPTTEPSVTPSVTTEPTPTEEHHAVPTDTPLEDRNQCTVKDCSTQPVVQNGKTIDLGPSGWK